jgi:hypothetical protein
MKLLPRIICLTLLTGSCYAEPKWVKVSEDQEAILEINMNSFEKKTGRLSLVQRNSSKRIDSVLFFLLSMPESDCSLQYGTIRYDRIGPGQSGEWGWVKDGGTVASGLAEHMCARAKASHL